MRVLLLSAGSRGDAEPYCALVQQFLSDLGDEIRVDLFLQSNLEFLANGYKGHPSFRLFTFPFNRDDFYKVTRFPQTFSLPTHHDQRMQNVRTMATILCELVLPCLPQILDVLDEQPSRNEKVLFVTSAFTRPLALLLAHARKNIKVILMHLQPLLPNPWLPSYRTSRKAFVDACTSNALSNAASSNLPQGITCEESYWRIEHALEEFFLIRHKNHWHRQCFGLNSSVLDWQELQQMLTGKHRQVFIANAYSNRLVPQLAGMPHVGSHVYDIGPLADGYIGPAQEELDLSLRDFLSSFTDERKPLCIGFGSMPFQNTGVVLEAVMTLRERAVLVGDIFCEIPETHPAIRHKRICCVSSAPYPILLPKCSMMICHGGIGVVQASLRAGIPCVVCPLMGDQFAWAEVIDAKGYGAKSGSKLSAVLSADIVQAVEVARLCTLKCHEVGSQIRQDCSAGPGAMMRLIKDLCSINKYP